MIMFFDCHCRIRPTFNDYMAQSLLILPFKNLDASSEQEYLSDGLTEELIAALTSNNKLKVASRTSSFYFKDKVYALEEIRNKLKVTHVLEGSIRTIEGQLRIIVHLTDALEGFTLWSETFRLDYKNLLEVQDIIISRILRRFDANGEVSNKQHSVPNNDVDAYNDYLKGLYFFNKYSMDNLAKSAEWMQKAIAKQPDFALAYATLSTCYLGLGGYIHPAYYPKSKAYALKAIELDTQLIEPLISLSYVQIFYDRDWEAAAISIDKALQLDIRSAAAHRAKGLLYLATGRKTNAIDAHVIATKYDPLNTIFINGLGIMFANAGRYEEGIAEYERCLALDESFRPAVEGIAWIKSYEKKWDEAIHYFKRYQKMVGDPLKGWYGLGYAYGKKGDFAKARNILDKLFLRKEQNPNESLDLDFAVVYMGVGQIDKTFAHLNSAVDKHHLVTVGYLASDPVFDELKDDRRYWELIHRLDLEEYVQPGQVSSLSPNVLSIEGDTQDKVDILQAQFLFAKAEGNYVRIVWKDGQQTQEYLLRATLSKIHQQIKGPDIFQTHRSFIVNIQHFGQLEKKGRQHLLVHSALDLYVPVSRSSISKVRDILTRSSRG